MWAGPSEKRALHSPVPISAAGAEGVREAGIGMRPHKKIPQLASSQGIVFVFGGDGGSRTRVRRRDPIQPSTCLVALLFSSVRPRQQGAVDEGAASL